MVSSARPGSSRPFEARWPPVVEPLYLPGCAGTEWAQESGEGAPSSRMRGRQIEALARPEQLQQHRVEIAREPARTNAHAVLRRRGQVLPLRDRCRDVREVDSGQDRELQRAPET